MAWLNLAMVLGSIYGPRAITIKRRLDKQTKPRPQVVNMPRPAEPNNAPATPPRPQTVTDVFGLEGLAVQSGVVNE